MDRFGITISGFGGQGVLFVGHLLSYAGMLEGNYVAWIPSYGAEMRGGTAHCFVTIAKKEVSSPLVNKPDALLVFNKPSLEKFEMSVAEGGHLLINSSLVDVSAKRTDLNMYYIPANAIADELGDTRVTNLVMLGALVKATGIVKLDSVFEALEGMLPESRKKMLPLNKEALNRGMGTVDMKVS